uniref:Uncharacterized protein n=1 Tax=Parascaris univalens TaxID=6257 RepID=A0A914ZRM5_PARUN
MHHSTAIHFRVGNIFDLQSNRHHICRRSPTYLHYSLNSDLCKYQASKNRLLRYYQR